MNPGTESSQLAQELFAAKQQRRRKLAALPVEEKFEILLRLQRIAFDTANAMHRPARTPWVSAKQPR